MSISSDFLLFMAEIFIISTGVNVACCNVLYSAKTEKEVYGKSSSDVAGHSAEDAGDQVRLKPASDD